jgi:Uma2 family endonuclease
MPLRLTREEFHRWTEGQRGRFERVAGEPVAMSPERAQHVRLKNRVWAALDRAIQQAGLDCEALGDGITVEVDADTDYEPDAVEIAGRACSRMRRLRPTRSLSSRLCHPPQSIDTGEKLADYFRVPSIQHYLIVRARQQEIIHHRRSGDAIVSHAINAGAIRLDPSGITLDVAEVYGGAG